MRSVKYTADIREPQLAGGVRLAPGGGSVTEEQAARIAADPWGKRLMDSGRLSFDAPVAVAAKPRLGMSVDGAAAPDPQRTAARKK